MNKLLTVREVAEILRVSEKTIFRYIKAGKISAFRVIDKGSWRFLDKDLEKFINKLKKENKV